MEDLIKTIELLRIKQCISKRSLAAKAGISEEYYWRIITGKTPGCAYTIIDTLAQQVGLSVTHQLTIGLLDQFVSINQKGKPKG